MKLDLADLKQLFDSIEQQGIDRTLDEGYLSFAESDHVLHNMLKKYWDLNKQIQDYVQRAREQYEI